MSDDSNVTQDDSPVKEFVCDTSNFLPDKRQSARKSIPLPAVGRRITKKKKAMLLEELAKTGILAHACRVVGISQESYYKHCAKDPAFLAEAERAVAFSTDALEAEAIRRASVGTTEKIYHAGKECGTKKVYSDALLMLLLKGRKSEVYGARAAIEISGKGGGPIEISQTKEKLLGLLNIPDEDVKDITEVDDDRRDW